MRQKLLRLLKKTVIVISLMIGSVLAGIIVWGSLFYFLERRNDLTDRKVILKMTGVILPEFRVKDSRVKHSNNFDFEKTIITDIEFLEMPDQKFFELLDEKVKADLEGSGNLEGSWMREGSKYTYSLLPMGAKSEFVREDGFFYLYMNNKSKRGSISYGNY